MITECTPTDSIVHKMRVGELEQWYSNCGLSPHEIIDLWQSEVSPKERRKYQIRIRHDKFMVVATPEYAASRSRTVCAVLGILAAVATFTLLYGVM